MDKRFFLALLLSLVVVALSQLLFPVPRAPKTPATVPVPTAAAPAGPSPAVQAIAQPTAAITVPSDSTTAPAAIVESRLQIETEKSVYRFTNIGAAPVSAVMLEYAN